VLSIFRAYKTYARLSPPQSSVPPMAAKEIEAEIEAYRAERRRAAGA
jgi:hypothetical protein